MPVPVELTSFTASRKAGLSNAVQLTWSTATETNNYGFEVERRLGNGEAEKGGKGETETGRKGEAEKGRQGEWEKVGFVKGHGTTITPQVYSFTDHINPQSVRYRLKQIDTDGSFSYSQEVGVTIGTQPHEFHLYENYPNPFNSTTTITYTLPERVLVHLGVYDMLGREVKVLVQEVMSAGVHEVVFEASGLPSGVYVYRFTAGARVFVRKAILMK
jgi:hypothetical protein